MKKVAFICVHNSCRSQIAEALGRRFGDRCKEGTGITVLRHEFGPSKFTVKLWRERIDQGGARR